MRRIRYRLSALLLLTTALVALLGVAQWRKNRIVEKCAYFEQYDVQIELPNGAVDLFWQRRPSKAIIRVPSESYSLNFHRLQGELDRFGIVSLVYLVQDIEIGNWEDAIDDPAVVEKSPRR
jgi:hypothetical protein